MARGDVRLCPTLPQMTFLHEVVLPSAPLAIWLFRFEVAAFPLLVLFHRGKDWHTSHCSTKSSKLYFSLLDLFLPQMSAVQPFQFDPTYPPSREPNVSEEESEDGNTKWCVCGGNCEAMLTVEECFCCQDLEDLNQKFDESGLFMFIWYILLQSCVQSLLVNSRIYSVCNVARDMHVDFILQIARLAGVNYITNHNKFRIVCLDTDILSIAWWLFTMHVVIPCRTPLITGQR